MAGSWWVEVGPAPAGGAKAPARVVHAASRPGTSSSFPFVLGPFTSQAEAQRQLQGFSPTQAAKNAITGALPGLTSIQGFLTDLSQRATWIRVLKIILGGAMVLVGVLHLSQVKDLAATATKVGKVAAL